MARKDDDLDMNDEAYMEDDANMEDDTTLKTVTSPRLRKWPPMLVTMTVLARRLNASVCASRWRQK